ncbi:NAD-dependent epimerase/dehydratase family protein [Paenibacillus flagellatus]|uniref:NAD(P)-dependent oxidoreductase n=1 Tax=Paenibacillus flagellatus TaxID=2211139 RepID=A0A2V5K9X3_9BACL|nr:NAD(P)-dependent oxidoreductase [Paenibacillus flagellatus]PYI55692.1 NAD(P)-dependent oxidoreductase [Paenibacillus flagellatus]
MNIVVAGASGVIGRALVPMLVEAGHEVVGLIRNPALAPVLEKMGARPVQVDVYDRDALFEAIRQAKPEAVVHQLTALGDRDFAANANIRTVGTRNLVDAALAAGVRKMIAQSISWAYAPGEGPATEEEPLDLDAPPPRRATVEGVYALERQTAEMPEHVILRYGLFYGEGTWYAKDGLFAEQARRGELAATDGVSSFVHVADAARAARLALDWPSGAVNVVDDEPAPGTDWLPVFAEAVGAPFPDARGGANRGERGASNAKARRYGWVPEAATWRTGFRDRLG